MPFFPFDPSLMMNLSIKKCRVLGYDFKTQSVDPTLCSLLIQVDFKQTKFNLREGPGHLQLKKEKLVSLSGVD